MRDLRLRHGVNLPGLLLHLPAAHEVVPAARHERVARRAPCQVLDAVVDGLRDREVAVRVLVPAGGRGRAERGHEGSAVGPEKRPAKGGRQEARGGAADGEQAAQGEHSAAQAGSVSGMWWWPKATFRVDHILLEWNPPQKETIEMTKMVTILQIQMTILIILILRRRKTILGLSKSGESGCISKSFQSLQCYYQVTSKVNMIIF
jgi:hypothetical protein